MNSFTRVAAACVVLVAACGGGGDDGGGGDTAPLFTVTYIASGPAPLQVTYRDASGETVQELADTGRFSREVLVREGDPLLVSAATPAFTFVTASISAGDTLLMAAAARGSATATATCCLPVGAP
jgi:hypothetical protein